MIPEHRTIAPPKAMTFTGLLEKIRYEGAYPTRERAEEALSAVLVGLGAQITGEERVAFAAALPREAAHEFTTLSAGAHVASKMRARQATLDAMRAGIDNIGSEFGLS